MYSNVRITQTPDIMNIAPTAIQTAHTNVSPPPVLRSIPSINTETNNAVVDSNSNIRQTEYVDAPRIAPNSPTTITNPSYPSNRRYTQPIAIKNTETGPITNSAPAPGSVTTPPIDPLEQALLQQLSGGGGGSGSGYNNPGYNYIPLSTPSNTSSGNNLWVILLIVAALGAGGWYLYHKYFRHEKVTPKE